MKCRKCMQFLQMSALFLFMLSGVVYGDTKEKFQIYEGEGEFPLEFSMFYNSHYLGAGTSSLGALWRSNYGRLGYFSQIGGTVDITLEDSYGEITYYDAGLEYDSSRLYLGSPLGLTETGSQQLAGAWDGDVQLIYGVNCSAFFTGSDILICSFNDIIKGINVKKSANNTVEYYRFDGFIQQDSDLSQLYNVDISYAQLTLDKITNEDGVEHTITRESDALIVEHSNGDQLRFENDTVTLNDGATLKWKLNWDTLNIGQASGSDSYKRLSLIQKSKSEAEWSLLYNFNYLSNETTLPLTNWPQLASYSAKSVEDTEHQQFTLYKGEGESPLEYSLYYTKRYGGGYTEAGTMGSAGLWRNTYERNGTVWKRQYDESSLVDINVENVYGVKTQFSSSEELSGTIHNGADYGLTEPGTYTIGGSWQSNNRLQVLSSFDCTEGTTYAIDCKFTGTVGANIRQPETNTIEYYRFTNSGPVSWYSNYYYIVLEKITYENGIEHTLIRENDSLVVRHTNGEELTFSEDGTVSLNNSPLQWKVTSEWFNYTHMYGTRYVERIASVKQKSAVESEWEPLLDLNYLPDNFDEYWDIFGGYWVQWSGVTEYTHVLQSLPSAE